MNEVLEACAKNLFRIADELEQAAAQARSAAALFSSNQGAKACSHVLVVQGHCAVSQELLDETAKSYRLKLDGD